MKHIYYQNFSIIRFILNPIILLLWKIQLPTFRKEKTIRLSKKKKTYLLNLLNSFNEVCEIDSKYPHTIFT